MEFFCSNFDSVTACRQKSEVNRFNKLYQRHQRYLKLQGKAQKTIDAYSRAIRRVRDYFDCCPDKLEPKHFEQYFAYLVESHSWSTVTIPPAKPEVW